MACADCIEFAAEAGPEALLLCLEVCGACAAVLLEGMDRCGEPVWSPERQRYCFNYTPGPMITCRATDTRQWFGTQPISPPRWVVARHTVADADSVGEPHPGASTTAYDAAGEMVGHVDQLGNRSTTVYDAAGRRTSSIDPMLRRSTTVYDAANETIASINALGNRTTFSYDLAGRRYRTLDANSKITTSVFDVANRGVATINALGNRTTTVFDKANRTIALIDPNSAPRRTAPRVTARRTRSPTSDGVHPRRIRIAPRWRRSIARAFDHAPTRGVQGRAPSLVDVITRRRRLAYQ